MSHALPTLGLVRRVTNAAIELNAQKQLSRQKWEWIAQWIAGVGDGYLPDGLALIANREPFRMVTTNHSAYFVALDDEPEPEPEPEPAVCPACSSPGEQLGKLGNLDHYRCRGCGITYHLTEETTR